MHKRYQNTRFLTSATSLRGMPPDIGREAAFAGRSNAGKSSALNRICHQKSLARTSKTPGRTQQINFFTVTDDRYLVDLPGYGYARVAKSQQQQWGALLRQYLLGRRSLAGLILLMDIRHPLTPLDGQLLDLCQEGGVPVHVLLTKADKLKRGPAMATLRTVERQLDREGLDASVQLFSSLNGEGLEAAQARLDDWLAFDADVSDSGPIAL
ncbi:ribosome biogenesis GTP-binding protein YihA/YsxC [Acidihalobacter prosperus]|uniref:Probable GTP-binding protein EngB n=1 Tax=Acidihalobacter prosperus TaxID=160660 RepID=A0A1A6C3R6_9GAMM|nr:ribosome biogenesis GTP-binding protein YihA/YsxC [Acidihalobacter prosperus]OBS09207.1 YihA family ribosome biogenesis GTP-binding protein [Acidihalobacter prosperus]